MTDSRHYWWLGITIQMSSCWCNLPGTSVLLKLAAPKIRSRLMLLTETGSQLVIAEIGYLVVFRRAFNQVEAIVAGKPASDVLLCCHVMQIAFIDNQRWSIRMCWKRHAWMCLAIHCYLIINMHLHPLELTYKAPAKLINLALLKLPSIIRQHSLLHTILLDKMNGQYLIYWHRNGTSVSG